MAGKVKKVLKKLADKGLWGKTKDIFQVIPWFFVSGNRRGVSELPIF
jgi:hypothetical protein